MRKKLNLDLVGKDGNAYALHGETLLAIEMYLKVQQAIKKVERLENELNKLVSHIPKEDMENYVMITNKLANQL